MAEESLAQQVGGSLQAEAEASVELGAAEPTISSETFGEGVRSTSWRSPSAQLAAMHLMPGFEMRLFASEPDIAKPLNMAFDGQGRMWVTQSVEYPYAVSDNETGRDAVMILEDTDGDGGADKFTKFADGLNIPIGVLPYGDGCICFSIPNLWYLRDTDGDGVCDKREVVLGPFDTSRDTHGMVNALRDGGDGWIYACHGFNNQSTVSGSDGHEIVMHSGNTFRFRPDGSRVEHMTRGQVNPFGMAEDEWGYRYSADCHSKPITQLIRGACYPSFGKPHDGLGFLPPMVDHLHGSTAICGLVSFPSTSHWNALRGQMLSGNVMTSRINRNRVSYRGATAVGEELPDFLTCDDPWFRPVDLRIGPDGHLYVADFYNKIIGHYEVPLDHPERDRTSGRIWQIRAVQSAAIPLVSEDIVECRRITVDFSKSIQERQLALKRVGRSSQLELDLVMLLMVDEVEQIRVAALGLGSEWISRNPDAEERPRVLARAINLLHDGNAHVARAAAELLGLHGSDVDVVALLDRLSRVSVEDAVLKQSLRIAIRNILERCKAGSNVWERLASCDHADILLGLGNSAAANALLLALDERPDWDDRDAVLSHIARHASPKSMDACVALVKKMTVGDRSRQFELLGVLLESLESQRPPAALHSWAVELVTDELGRVDMTQRLVEWTASDGNNWGKEHRSFRGAADGMLVSSLSRGEKYVGRWVSDEFQAPKSIGFHLAGHNGFPKQKDHGKNRVHLVRCRDGKIVREVTTPRNDVAEWIEWNTADLEGEFVRLECIDGDAGRAYAWIAIGDFSPGWIGQSAGAESFAKSLDWIERLQLVSLSSVLEESLSAAFSRRLRLEAARVLSGLKGNAGHAILAEQIKRTGASPPLADSLIEAVHQNDEKQFELALEATCRSLSASQQVAFAVAWTKGNGDLGRLLDLVSAGWLSPYVLMDADVEQVLDARMESTHRSRVHELTGKLDPEVEGQSRLTEILSGLKRYQPDSVAGEQLFTKHCANCHQLRGKGRVVGPQLDGAVTRSVERLLEDIITPDRNVDRAFRTSSFLLEDGRVIVGLVTVDTSTEIRVVESNGKARVIDPQAVEQRREAGRSLMPGNLRETLSPQQLGDLIGFVRGA